MRKSCVDQARGNAVGSIALLLCFMLVAEHVSAAQVRVGGGPGWLLGVSYSKWVKNVKIRAKDTLFFDYPVGQHNVIQVPKANYRSCSTKGALKYMSSGSDKFVVSKPGTYYFICGVGTHCQGGMKVAITVST